MAHDIGTRINNFAGNAAVGTRTITAAGESALIMGVYVAATAADVVNFNDADGTTLATIAVAANATEDITTPFIASNGFVADSTLATSQITIIWRPGV